MAEIDSAPSLSAVSRDKKSASVRQADVSTNFSPIDSDKKSAVLRQKIDAKILFYGKAKLS